MHITLAPAPLPRHPPAQAYLDDPMGYAFMLPTAVAVATSCQLSGIGGAALFSPIFLLVFPLLGADYPLDSPAAAIASALLTEVFGFSSGLSGYARRGLVAWPVALQYAGVAVPLAFAGALCAGALASEPALLRGVYAALMLGLSSYLVLSPKPDALEELAADECAIDGDDGADGAPKTRALQAADGRVFTCARCRDLRLRPHTRPAPAARPPPRAGTGSRRAARWAAWVPLARVPSSPDCSASASAR